MCFIRLCYRLDVKNQAERKNTVYRDVRYKVMHYAELGMRSCFAWIRNQNENRREVMTMMRRSETVKKV